jgi:hypothetical protein
MVASDSVEEADTLASPQPIMEFSPLRVASDSVEEATQSHQVSPAYRDDSQTDGGNTLVVRCWCTSTSKLATPLEGESGNLEVLWA